MLSERDVLDRWKELAGDTSSRPWQDDEDVSGLIEKFRPHGEGCDAILEGLPQAAEITARLREVYAATSGGKPGVYMKPQPEQRLSRERVEQLLAGAVAKWKRVSEALGDEKAVGILSQPPAIQWCEDKTNLREELEPEGKQWEMYMVDLRIDFMASLNSENPARLLKEELYTATTSPEVQNYVLWPLYADGSPVADLFQEEFELWKGAIDWYFKNERTLLVCYRR